MWGRAVRRIADADAAAQTAPEPGLPTVQTHPRRGVPRLTPIYAIPEAEKRVADDQHEHIYEEPPPIALAMGGKAFYAPLCLHS